MYIKGEVRAATGKVTINGETHIEHTFICTAWKAGNSEAYTCIREKRIEAIEGVLKMMST